MELRQFRQSSGKPVEIVELKCSLRYAKEILGFCLPVGVSSNPDREPPLKPCRNQTTDIHRSVKTVGDMEDCQVLSNTGPGVSSSFWEREGWLGAAQHNLGNDLSQNDQAHGVHESGCHEARQFLGVSVLLSKFVKWRWGTKDGTLKMHAWPVLPALPSFGRSLWDTRHG